MGKWDAFSDDQKNQLLESLEGLYNESEAIQEAVEKKFGISDPQLITRRAIRKENDELREKLESLEARGREKEIRDGINNQKDFAQKKYRLTDEEMKDVSKLMIEAGIGNYDKAADYYVLSKKASAVPSSDKHLERTSLTLPGDKEWFTDRIGKARKEAYAALAEIERNRG